MTILTQILEILPRAILGSLLFALIAGSAYFLGDWLQYRRLVKNIQHDSSDLTQSLKNLLMDSDPWTVSSKRSLSNIDIAVTYARAAEISKERAETMQKLVRAMRGRKNPSKEE